jgi:hypothetical protein
MNVSKHRKRRQKTYIYIYIEELSFNLSINAVENNEYYQQEKRTSGHDSKWEFQKEN